MKREMNNSVLFSSIIHFLLIFLAVMLKWQYLTQLCRLLVILCVCLSIVYQMWLYYFQVDQCTASTFLRNIIDFCQLCFLLYTCIFLSLQIFLGKNGCGKWLFGDGIHSFGDNRRAWTPSSPLLTFSNNIYGNHIRKFDLDHSNCTELSPSHPHVLFSL